MGDKYPANPVTLREHIRKVRMEKGLLQEEVAKLIGTTTDTITNWENGRSEPQIQFYPKIISFLGNNPFKNEAETLAEKIKQYRFIHGLSHKKFGKLIGVDGSTISCWENSVNKPLAKFMTQIQKVIDKVSCPN